MANLTVLKFNSLHGAKQVAAALEPLYARRSIAIDDAAAIFWPVGDDKPTTCRFHGLAAPGRLGGAFWGLLFGFLFFVPFPHRPSDTVTDTLNCAFLEFGLSDQFLAEVHKRVHEGTSALFVFSRQPLEDALGALAKGLDLPCEIMVNLFSSRQTERLREVFARVTTRRAHAHVANATGTAPPNPPLTSRAYEIRGAPARNIFFTDQNRAGSRCRKERLMPLELQIIRAGEFIRLGAQGRLDLDNSRALLAELAAACRRRGIDRALLDLRDLEPGTARMLTPHDIAALIGTFREIGFTSEHKLAVLYAEDPYHGARLFAFLGTLRGWRVRAFPGFEEALTWLASVENATDEKDEPTHTQTGTEIRADPPAFKRITKPAPPAAATEPLHHDSHQHDRANRRFVSRKEKP